MKTNYSIDAIHDQFLIDISNHNMVIFTNNRVNRHLRFREEKSIHLWFDIITWENCLCIRGDMGTFLFECQKDMFNFFKSNTDEIKINPYYWSEKLISKSEEIENFNVKKIEKYIITKFREYNLDNLNKPKKDRAYILRELREDILPLFEKNESCNCDFFENLCNYYHIDFIDWSYSDFKDYTYRYIWCLFAIVWAIKKYNNNF